MEEKYLIKNLMKASPLEMKTAKEDKYLEIWSAATGSEPGICAHEICNRPATIGALAKKAFSSDHTTYIYPACASCARRTELLYVAAPIVALS